MLKLKPHLSVEQIAKKHRLNVSFIQKQLDMGEPIEHEHTKDHTLAMDIALQHLDEIPDYYTRLKKMEADAKKEHKKFKDVKESAISELENGLKKLPNPTYDSIDNLMRNIMKKHDISAKNLHNSFVKVHNKTPDTWIKTMKESQEEKRYCPLCDKKEAASECGYGKDMWNKVTMAEEFQLKVSKGILRGSESQVKRSTGPGALTPSAAAQLGPKAVELQKKKAAAVSLPKVKEEKLVDKILGELEEEKKGLWSNIRARREKGLPRKKPGQKGYPKTLDIGEDLAQARKNVGASKCWPGKVAKGTKIKGGKEVPNCVSSENVTIEDANGNTFIEVVDLIKSDPIKGFKSQIEEATRLQSETGNILAVILSWRGKTYSIRMFFPQLKVPSKKDVTAEIQKVYPGAIVLQFNISTLQAGMPLIQVVNSKSKNYLLNNGTIGEEVELDEEGPVLSVGRGEKLPVSKGAGLTAKGRRRYNSETGSHLQAPVTGEVTPGSKAAKRRKNFCSRSRSWDGERGLAARRRWKC